MSVTKIQCPCPFCSSTENLQITTLEACGRKAVSCESCKIDGPFCATLEEALDKWEVPFKRTIEALDRVSILEAAVANNCMAMTSEFVASVNNMSIARTTLMMQGMRKKTTTALNKKPTLTRRKAATQ